MTATTDPWIVWTYATRPGWEVSGRYPNRDEASEVRDVLIDFDDYPSEFVAVRHEREGAPKRRPPRALIDQVNAEAAAGVGR